MQELGKIMLQVRSGGNVENFIHKKLRGRMPFSTNLDINILLSKIIKFPIVLKLPLS